MNLKERIEADLKTAMLAKDEDGKRTLRAIKSLILVEETKEGGTGALSPDDELKLLTRAAKQRRESAEIFRTQNREDLAAVEQAELAIIERYLPQQLSEAELKAKIGVIIERVGARGPQDLGKVMGVASKELAGQAEGKLISQVVKDLLINLS